jgi:hypothetical protein
MTRIERAGGELIPAREHTRRVGSPRPSRGAVAKRRNERDGVRRPAGGFTLKSHPGGDGVPPGPTTRPCQELADDLFVALPAAGLLERDKGALGALGLIGAMRRLERTVPKRKRGPSDREVAATGAPKGARRDPATDHGAIGLRFSARHPLEGEPSSQPGRICVAGVQRRARVRAAMSQAAGSDRPGPDAGTSW